MRLRVSISSIQMENRNRENENGFANMSRSTHRLCFMLCSFVTRVCVLWARVLVLRNSKRVTIFVFGYPRIVFHKHTRGKRYTITVVMCLN